MAELVDAADSKSAVRKDVQVRFLFRALLFRHVLLKQRDHYSEIETCHGRTQKKLDCAFKTNLFDNKTVRCLPNLIINKLCSKRFSRAANH